MHKFNNTTPKAATKKSCIQKKAAGIAPRRKTIIKLLSLLITESSRHSEECLLLQAIQDNSAHFESKAALFPFAPGNRKLNDFV